MKLGAIFINLLMLLTFMVTGQKYIDVAEDYGMNFSYSNTEYGGGISFVDFNQDGWDDVSFATGAGIPLKIFVNNSEGFDLDSLLIGDTSEVRQVLWVDYNDDSLLDLFLAVNGVNQLYKNIGDGQLVNATDEVGLRFDDRSTYCVSWIDYDKDGYLDLFTTQRDSNYTGNVQLFKYLPQDTFINVTESVGILGMGNSVLAMTSMDYNNDGWPDIFLGQDWEQGNQLLHNNGDGTFTDVSERSGIDALMNSMTATIIDINSDGYEDVYVTNTTEGNLLFVNQQDETFREASKDFDLALRSITFGAVFIDMDHDGDDDLHIGGQYVNYMYESMASGKFKRRSDLWGLPNDKNFNTGVAKGDFNNDGLIDIVRNSITREGFTKSNNTLLRNIFANGNYIKVSLQGTLSNSYAIGARVYTYIDGQRQMKRIACGESFSSQHSYVQHFGVGNAQRIDSLLVLWPSGVVTRLYDIQSNQQIQITESTSACTDETACNYVPDAMGDDGSCIYSDRQDECIWTALQITTSTQDATLDYVPLEVLFDPASKSLEIRSTDQNDYHINIVNVSGEIVHADKANAQSTIIPMNGLASGIYFVHLRGLKSMVTERVFVSH